MLARIDIGNCQLAGERPGYPLLAKPAPASLLLLQRLGYLLLAQHSLLDQQVANADLFRAGHPFSGMMQR